MFVVSERPVRIRDGKGFDAPMLQLGPKRVAQFKRLKESELTDDFLHVFEDIEDAAAFAGVLPEQKEEKATKKKATKKKATKKKAARKKAGNKEA